MKSTLLSFRKFNHCHICTCKLYNYGPEFTISLTISVSSQIQHFNTGQTFWSLMYKNVTQSYLRHLITWLEYLELVWLRNRGDSCHSCLVQRWSHWHDRPGPHSLCWEWDYQWCTWCPRSEEKEGGSEGGREGEEGSKPHNQNLNLRISHYFHPANRWIWWQIHITSTSTSFKD